MTTTGGFHEENGVRRERGLLERLVVATALIVLALSAGAGTVCAHDKGEKSEQTVIKSRSFTIPLGQCSQLPGDLVVEGLGLERTRTEIDSGKSGTSMWVTRMRGESAFTGPCLRR